MTGAGGFDNRFRTSGDKVQIFFYGSFCKQDITGSEEIETMNRMSSSLAITDDFLVCMT
jgi:hypothetical protein